MNSRIEKSLEHALSILKEEWAHSFVFSQEKYIEAKQLGYAVGKSQCLLAELELSVTPPKAPAARAVTVDEHFNLLFLPSFTSGTTTVGFEVMDHNKIANAFTKVPRYLSKFVRDDEQGIFLSIAEHPALGVTDVTFGAMSSPGQRDHVLAQFHFKAFRKMMSKLKEGFKWDELRRSLTYCYCSVEMRPCIACGSISDKGCECELPMKRKIHPLDLTSEAHNIGVYEGVFRGLAELKIYSDGQTTFEFNFDSYSEAHFVDDSRLQEELLGWAAQRCIESCNPTSTTLPSSLKYRDRPYFMKAMMDSLPQGPNQTSRNSQRMTNDPSMIDFVIHEQSPFVDGRTCKFGTVALDAGTLREFNVQKALNMLELFRKEGQFQGSVLNSSASIRESSTSAEAGSDQNYLFAAVCNGATAKLLPSASLCGEDGIKSFDIETRGGSQPLPAPVPLWEDIMAHRLETETGQFFHRATETTSILEAGAFVRESPVVAAPSMITGYGCNSAQPGRRLYPASSDMDGMSLGQKNKFSDEIVQKRELRKARNRESARRSSIRKNLKFRKLQEDLTSIKEVEAELRNREQCIRKENISLREALRR